MRTAERHERRAAVARRQARRRRWPVAVLVVLSTVPVALFGAPQLFLVSLVLAAVVLGPTSRTAPASTWRRGAEGEVRIGAVLDELVSASRGAGRAVAVLHDRRIPRREENIDHLVLTGGGVHVVETKTLTGHLRIHDGRRIVGRRTSLDAAAAQAGRQAATVRHELIQHGVGEVPVLPVVCLVNQPDVAPFRLGDVVVCGRLHLLAQVTYGPHDGQVRSVAWALDESFHPA